MRVLVVDDSVVFRSAIKTALDGVQGVEVVATANNGKIALQKLKQLSVELVTLDMEMPEMGGLETIKEIKKANFPVKIIVFSAYTRRGSEAALEALAAGADDFVGKPEGGEGGYEAAAAKIKEELLPKVLQFSPASTLPGGAVTRPVLGSTAPLPTVKSLYAPKSLHTFRPSVLVIGSSTGGPPALETILKGLSLPYRIPILIAQHMPPVFTDSLAKRLQNISGMEAAEGKDQEEIKPNRIYVAPGNYHMGVVSKGTQLCISLNQAPQRNSVRPAVDVLFETAAECYGARTMALVLTGMGEDGLVGAHAVKKAGGGVMIQDRSSCVVFGMPGAIYQAQIFDGMGGLVEINETLRRLGS